MKLHSKSSKPLAKIIGVGMTPLGKLNKTPTELCSMALEKALANARIKLHQLGGLLSGISLAEHRFMQAHYLATYVNLLPSDDVVVRTIDTGGASPISMLLEAKRMIENEGVQVVAVVAGDSVGSMDSESFLKLADNSCRPIEPHSEITSPIIPKSYDRVARWQMENSSLSREQLAMVSVLMSRNSSRVPHALNKRAFTLEEVLNSKRIGDVTNILECARRADGAGALIIASSNWMERHGMSEIHASVIVSGSEGSGPISPPKVIDETMFSCEEASRFAYEQSQLRPEDIQYFGLYDCFPICFVRAVEAVGLAPKGKGGEWVERKYRETMEPNYDPHSFPVNTHGGLLSFGSPWEVPSLFSVIEAHLQLQGLVPPNRRINNCRRALVYGNGGIFSASAIAILSDGKYGYK